MGMTGQQIYDNFQSGAGGEDLNGAADILNELAATYEDRRQGFRDLAVAMEQGWTGDAQDAAARGAAPLVVEHDLAGTDLARGQDLGHRQVGSFDGARNAVEPVPPRPEQPDPWDNMTSMGAANQSYEHQVTAHNDAAQRNVDIMNGYTSDSTYNTTLPTGSGTLAADQGTVAANDQTGQAGGVIHGRNNGTGPGPGGGGSGPSSAAPAPAAPGPVAPSGGPLPSGPPSGSLTTPSGATPGTAPDRGGNPPPRGPVATPDGSGPGSPPLSARPAPTGGGAPRPGGPGAARPVTGSPEGTAYRGGGGRVGGPEPGPGRGAGTGPLTGGPLAGGGAAEEGAARRGGAGTTGRPGTPGAGMTPMGAAGGRGQGGDDYEHERPSYLVQEDGESNFGVDELTAPPVIGDEDDD